MKLFLFPLFIIIFVSCGLLEGEQETFEQETTEEEIIEEETFEQFLEKFVNGDFSYDFMGWELEENKIITDHCGDVRSRIHYHAGGDFRTGGDRICLRRRRL